MKPARHAEKAIWSGVLVLAVAATVWTLRPQPIPVTTATVTRGTLTSTVSGEGRTRVRELFVVAAPVDGQLERVVVQPGDDVHPNDTVAVIRPAASRLLDARSRAEAKAAAESAKAAAARADAAVAEARVVLEHAESQLETTRRLVRDAVAPAQEAWHRGHEAEMRRKALEASMAAAIQARAELARVSAALGAALDTSQPTAVRSPAAGKILRLSRESAGPIHSGTPLLELGDVSRLEIDADLLSSDAAVIRSGGAATVTGWGGAQGLSARVRRIDPAAFTKISALGLEEQRVHVILDLEDAPPAELGHGYRVDVSIVVWEGQDVLRVPSTALFRAGDGWAAFRVVDLRTRQALVDVGPSDGAFTLVTNGLRDGAEVVTQPSDMIEDGTRVRRR